MWTLTLLLACQLSGTLEDGNPLAPFDMNRINSRVIEAFRQAWRLADHGESNGEAGVLIVEEPGGDYSAKVQFDPDSLKQVRFWLTPGVVAIFHTHPNSSRQEPSKQDRRNSDQLQIPAFTLTNRGLWVYSPKTRKTSLVMPLLSWLFPKQWRDCR
jgi:hypothetical protein